MRLAIQLLLFSLFMLFFTTGCMGLLFPGTHTGVAPIGKNNRFEARHKAPPGTGNTVSLKSWESSQSPVEPKTLTKPLYREHHRILVVGDSLSVGIGAALSAILKNDENVTVAERGKVGSGLNSPRFFNWQKKFEEFIEKEDPELIVIIIGGNDAYNGRGNEEWAEQYRQSVQEFLNIAASRNVRVFWAGLPPMEKEDFTRKVRVTNDIIQSVCESSGNCRYIDTWPVTVGETEPYTKSKDWDGRKIMFRAGDGIHFTFTGYKIVSYHILAGMTPYEYWIPDTLDGRVLRKPIGVAEQTQSYVEPTYKQPENVSIMEEVQYSFPHHEPQP